MCAQFFYVFLPARSEIITAANSVIRCRCGMPVYMSLCRRSFPCWKCRVKRHFAPTFSNSLSADPRQRWLLVPRHRFPAEKEPTNVAFHRHLLGCGCADGFGGSLQEACTVVAALLRDGGPDVNGGRDGRGGRRGRIGVLTQGPWLFE